jgi:hypothetical protein
LASQPVDIHRDGETTQHSCKAVSMQAILIPSRYDRWPDKIIAAAAASPLTTPHIGAIPHIDTT